VPHLAGGDRFRHRADGLLDRRVEVDAVLVVEVDVIRTEPPEGLVDRRAHVVRPAVDAAVGAARACGVAELRREHDLASAPGDRAADEPLVVAELPAVDVGRVEERDTELERPVNRRDRLILVRLAVPGRHAHAAEPLRRHDEPLAECPSLHAGTL
jgi:hypothetical protein